MNELLIELGSTKWSGAFTEYFYIKKYKRKPGFRVEIRKRYYTGRWHTEAKGVVQTIKDAIDWLEKHAWFAVNRKEVLKKISSWINEKENKEKERDRHG